MHGHDHMHKNKTRCDWCACASLQLHTSVLAYPGHIQPELITAILRFKQRQTPPMLSPRKPGQMCKTDLVQKAPSNMKVRMCQGSSCCSKVRAGATATGITLHQAVKRQLKKQCNRQTSELNGMQSRKTKNDRKEHG